MTCASCKDVVRYTTNTEAFKRPLAHPFLSPSFTFTDEQLEAIYDGIVVAPPMRSTVQAKLYMRELLEEVLDLKTDVMGGSSRMNPMTSYMKYSSYNKKMMQFIRHGMAARTGLSWPEFIDQDPETCRNMYTACIVYSDERSGNIDEFIEELNGDK